MTATTAAQVPEAGTVAKLLREIALVEVLPRFRQLKSHEIREKSPGDFVTVADEAMEAALAPKLAALLPGSLLVGEEDCARDPSIIRRLASDQPVWVIDPVDGTANFAEGKEEFCTMMALVERDQVLGGWIYDPVTDTTSYAVKGEGAWSGGKRLAPPMTPNQYRGILAVGSKGDRETAQKVQKRRDRVQQVKSMRCAGLEYLRLARGEVDFLMFSGVMPWDHAPGAAIVQELGGYVGYFNADGYRPSQAETATGILAARDRATWDEVHRRMLGAD
ncbi:inositol monophosphatase family protein [Dongia sedimenti]|uniref:Inositol monophosphatase n=1 Tax=Dongia sedimenti TaxID=3064282 RepID=A0ABU0YLJ6_9PROT|nr:inositol monophosphatase [Rhodospirillaceae bacterium R-7]